MSTNPKPRKPIPLRMWAVIVKSARSEWIHQKTIARTRRGAWVLFCDGFSTNSLPEKYLKQKEVRLARVTVSEGDLLAHLRAMLEIVGELPKSHLFPKEAAAFRDALAALNQTEK